jgi:serine/threonine protein kinase
MLAAATVSDQILSSHSLPSSFQQCYRLMAEIGCGGFGVVMEAIRLSDGTSVAIKIIFKHKVPPSSWARDSEYGIIPLEVFLLRRLSHESIVRLLDLHQDELYVYMVMEMHGSPQAPLPESFPKLVRRPSMDLFECIESSDRLPEPTARFIFSQVVAAVAYLHSRGVIHRDIKDENILIDHRLRIKLVDFGSAAVEPGGNPHHLFDRFQGTIQYASPEILRGERYEGRPVDIWALGILLVNSRHSFTSISILCCVEKYHSLLLTK